MDLGCLVFMIRDLKQQDGWKTQDAEWRKNVARHCAFPVLHDIFSSFCRPGARFSKLPVITGPVKLFCFSFQVGVSEGLKIVQ